uniref:Uncharacterized protein n=1 Tax=Rhizophora mucronata TaxID=61149 RepID=A0A2P2PAU2_RHIMU
MSMHEHLCANENKFQGQYITYNCSQ